MIAGTMIDIAQGAGTLVNLNRASALGLKSLPGIGPETAAEIVNDRLANGPVSSIDDLVRVLGVGLATVEKLPDVASV
jgi:competence protein ComEA